MSPTSAGGKLRAVNAKGRPEESIALRVAVLVAVVSAATAVLREGVGELGLTVATVVGVPIAFWYSHHARHRDGFWLKVFLAGGVLVAFARFLTAASDSVQLGNVADVQLPLAELFLWVQLLHSLDVPARRDLLFSLASSLVLIAIAGALAVSLRPGIHIAVWAVAAVASLALAYRSELGDLEAVRPPPPSGRAAPAPVPTPARTPVTGRLRAALPVALTGFLALVVGTSAFLVIPAPSAVRALSFPARLQRALPVPVPGGLSNPTLGGASDAGGASRSSSGDSGGRASFGYFGFAERLDTGLRGRPDETLVMRVRSPRPDFWRGQTFDEWDGRTWSVSDGDDPRRVRGSGSISIPVPLGERSRVETSELVQTYYLEQSGPNIVFAAWQPSLVYFPDDSLYVLPDASMRTAVEMEKGAVYTVVSRRASVTPSILRSAPPYVRPVRPGRDGPDLTKYLQLPRDVPARVTRLSEELAAISETPFDMVGEIERWLAANTRYSLDVPPLPSGADAVETYLFEDRIGFCEQIGSAMVVLLRAAGIPARLVAGYVTGDRNPFTGLYDVRAKHAHAWAEVWFPGVGWQGFDPTAAVPLSGEQEAATAGAGLGSFISARFPKLPSVDPRVGVAIASLAVAFGGGGRLLRTSRARRRRRTAPWAVRLQDRLEGEGSRRGVPRGEGEAVGEYLARLRSSVLPDEGLASVEDVLQRAAYSGRPVEPAEQEEVEAAVDAACERWPAASRR